LHFGNQLALLCQQFCILLYSCHMCRKDFFLFFQNIRHLLLESKILFSHLIILPILNSLFHNIYILFRPFFILFLSYFLLLVNLIFHELIILFLFYFTA